MSRYNCLGWVWTLRVCSKIGRSTSCNMHVQSYHLEVIDLLHILNSYNFGLHHIVPYSLGTQKYFVHWSDKSPSQFLFHRISSHIRDVCTYTDHSEYVHWVFRTWWLKNKKTFLFEIFVVFRYLQFLYSVSSFLLQFF